MNNWSALSPTEQSQLLARPAQSNSDELRVSIADIIATVSQNGDQALLDYTTQFDGVELDSLALFAAAKSHSLSQVNQKLREAIDMAYDNIYQFHAAQVQTPVSLETAPGVRCELHHTALDSVGLYIPGGSAPLPSTVLMVGVAAKVAGCRRKVLCTPPGKDGAIHPAIIYAAQKCNIDEIYLVGGAQAIAAMAVGTESIAKVDKIFGPGNSFVTEAKQQVSNLPGGPAIDMPAGPSEVLVIAEANANADYVAADLLSQAEHGADSQAILVCDSEQLIVNTKKAVAAQLAKLSRRDIAQKAMENARYIFTEDMAQSIAVSNQYAPEHLIVHAQNARNLLSDIRNAGSIFLGQWSPESAGDYASGTNHVLPTYGYARNYSSLGVADFYRRYTVQELSLEGLKNIGSAIMDLAEAEGLDAHRNAVAIRLNQTAETRD